MQKPRWIVSQIGAREHYAVPVALHRRGLLAKFYTEAWAGRGRDLLRYGPGPMRSFAARNHPDLPASRIQAFTAGTIWQELSWRSPWNDHHDESIFDHYLEVGSWFATKVKNSLRAARLDARRHTFLGFNTGSLETLLYLKECGVLSVVDQIDPGRFERDLVLEEGKKWPGWEAEPTRIPEEYYQRLRNEWDIASLVLVNSDWSKQALVRQGLRSEKIIVVPLAYDAEKIKAAPKTRTKGTLTVLWLGSVILRKGIQYLIEAAKQLEGEDVRFLVAGPVGISASAQATAPRNVEFLGRLIRSDISSLYQKGDLFILPTISDGFGITQIEAMAHGLPVLTTPNCGKVVTDGRDGFIVPPRDPTAIADAIRTVLRDRALLGRLSEAALLKSRDFSYAAYADRLSEAVEPVRERAGRQSRRRLPLRFFVSQIGARQHYAVPLSLHRMGLLDSFFTEAWCRWGHGFLRAGPRSAQSLAARCRRDLPGEKVTAYTMQTIGKEFAWRTSGLSQNSADVYQHYLDIGSWFARSVRNNLEHRRMEPATDVFMGFNTGCLETLGYLREKGIFTIVDQIDPGKFEDDLVLAERQKWPGWERSTAEIPPAYHERIAREWALASLVLVNSRWTKHALIQQGVPPDKIVVIPLSFEVSRAPARPRRNSTEPLTILWLGSVILRKGIQYLIEAAKRLEGTNMRFVIVGPVGISKEALATAPKNMEFRGRFTRDQVQHLYQHADAFVLPTLSDGFAITQLEAMANGLPVIATPNCGEVVTDGKDGFVVEAGSVTGLVKAIQSLEADRESLAEMSRAAAATVRDRFTLSGYAQRLVSEVTAHKAREITQATDDESEVGTQAAIVGGNDF